MTGVFSIAEVVDDSNKKPEKTIFMVLEKDENKKFNKFQLKSLQQIKKMVENNGATVINGDFKTLVATLSQKIK